MEPRWIRGIWPGKRWGSDEHIVSMPGGKVVRARNVRPRADGFDRDLFDQLIGRPRDPFGVWDGAGENPHRVVTEVLRTPVEREAAPTHAPKVRATLICREYFDKCAFSEGCAKCRAIQRGDETQPTLAHNAACRKRIEDLMRTGPTLRQRVAAADEGRVNYLAGEVERGEVAPDPQVAEEDPPEVAEPEIDPAEEDDIPEAGEGEDQGGDEPDEKEVQGGKRR